MDNLFYYLFFEGNSSKFSRSGRGGTNFYVFKPSFIMVDKMDKFEGWNEQYYCNGWWGWGSSNITGESYTWSFSFSKIPLKISSHIEWNILQENCLHEQCCQVLFTFRQYYSPFKIKITRPNMRIIFVCSALLSLFTFFHVYGWLLKVADGVSYFE